MTIRSLAPFLFLAATPLLAAGEKPRPPKPVAGKADLLKHVPKKFATLVSVDAENFSIRLRIEGENEESSWPVLPDAEIKVHGWWGRLEQLRSQDRAWVWFAIDRDKKPTAILMIADEMSEQDIHREPLVIRETRDTNLTVHVPDAGKVPERTLQTPGGYDGPRNIGATLYAQTSGREIRRGVGPEEFESLRQRQREWLRALWRKQGLPGTVSTLHPLGGEMEIILDHEAIRWGRYLKNGDKVTIPTTRPINAVVHTVTPWRERTRLRLVTNSGLDQLDLAVGRRAQVIVPEPPEEVQQSMEPTDIGRLDERQERLDWFLNSVYCSCGIRGDRCTGMFYVQASCNVNACGTPGELLGSIGEYIDDGLSDREIFTRLVKDRGRDIWQPHLLR